MSVAAALTFDVDAVVLDVEGTTTPIAFVHDVLFPYARAQLAEVVASGGSDAEARSALATLTDEHAAEPAAIDLPAAPSTHPAAAAYLSWLMDRDRKSTALKTLQGLVWRAGYAAGELRAPVFPDVAPAFARWQATGLALAIYSSGSVEAQQLLFRHSDAGDLTPNLSRYFDTRVGAKREAASYARIAAALGFAPQRVLFLSDVGEELAAAAAAGVHAVLVTRPGNPAPSAAAASFVAVSSFDQLTLHRG